MTADYEAVGKAMMQAWKRIKGAQKKLWGDWMIVGDGLMEGRRWAMKQANTDKPEGKAYNVAYSEWLNRYKMTDMHEADRTKLLQLMEERPAIEEWRASLEPHDRMNLNHPTTVWRKWRAKTRPKKKRKPGTSASEAARARATIEELQARIVELEEELGAARARIAELEDELRRVPA